MPPFFSGYHGFLAGRPVLTRAEEAKVGAELKKARSAYWAAVLRTSDPEQRARLVDLLDADRRTRPRCNDVRKALGSLRRRRSLKAVQAAADLLAEVDSPCSAAHSIADFGEASVDSARARLEEVSGYMVECNLRLVIHEVVKRRGAPRDMDDSVNDGALGLIRAVELWDPDRGLRFSTYAVHWIRHGLLRGLQNHGRTVRAPSHAITIAMKIKRAEDHLETELCRKPTDDELAAKLGLSKSHVILGRMVLGQHMVGLDDPCAPGLPSTMGDTLRSSSPDPETKLLTSEHIELVGNILKAFEPPRHREILMARFGFERDPETLEMVGSRLGISRERVRQLEREALRALRQQLERVGIRRGDSP